MRASDTTPEHVKACEELWDKAGGFINEGPFTPFGFHEAGTPPKSYLQFPGVGSPNWGGTAADPTTGYVYIGTYDSALTGWIEKKVPGGNYGNLTEGSPLPMDRGSYTGPGPYSSFSAGGMSVPAPAVGTLLRHQRQHRRDRLESRSRHKRTAAEREAERRRHRRRGTDGHRRRACCSPPPATATFTRSIPRRARNSGRSNWTRT